MKYAAEYAPSGKKVIFSWTWLAYTSMEMWQSCAFVEIQGIPSKENAAKFRALPPVWRGSLYEFSDTCVSKDRYHLVCYCNTLGLVPLDFQLTHDRFLP